MPEGKTHWIVNQGAADLFFVVDTSQNQVALQLSGNPLLGDSATIKYFEYGENVALENISLAFPYQFGAGLIPPQVTLGWIDKAGNQQPLVEFGANGLYTFPEVNQYYPVGNYVTTNTDAVNDWGIRILAVNGSVNMLNTPAALNGQTMAARLLLSVRHTYGMIV